MNKTEILKIAKEVITTEVENFGFKVIQIILFGSRARGDENSNSDWDFYVIIDKNIEFKTKKEITMLIRRKLSDQNIDADILINSKNNIEKCKNYIGYICYEALNEGIKI